MNKLKRKFRKITLFDVLLYTFFALIAVVTIFPLWNILMISITPNSYYVENGIVLFPTEFTAKNYEYIFTTSAVLDAVWTSVKVSVGYVAYGMLLMVPLAYGLSRPDLPGKKWLITFVLLPMYFGGGIIPFYLVVKELKLIDSLWALIIPYGVNIFYLIIIKNSFTSVPQSLIEAAKLDGANDFVILLRIVIPLAKATIATFALFMLVDKWNDWYSSMLFLSDGNKFPLAKLLRDIIYNNVSVGDMSQMIAPGASGDKLYAGMEGIKMATVIVALVPILCVYPFLQKYFVKGVATGAIKS